MSSINSLSSNFLQSILNTALQATGLTSSATGLSNNSPTQSTAASSTTQQSDNGQLSQFAQLSSVLQQLQQSNPAQYQQVTQQISANLQSAAQTAQADGNTTAATRLNQLYTDFSNASQSGQLPNLQDLAQAIAGGHHGHHHHFDGGGSASADSNSTTSSSSTSSASGSSQSAALTQFLAALEGSGTQSNSFNPATIIFDTLSNAGIDVSNS